VQVPVTFDAEAVAIPAGIVCGTPRIGNCASAAGCTRSMGFYRENPEVTNALITAAGGSIVLGISGQGLSFTVTTDNANNVLSLNTPSPPAPAAPPHAPQYQNLYAQLLTANLNVLSGATCDFATQAIANANTFLAESPAGGKPGAPQVQEPLALFNSGNATGCPAHCPE